MSESSENTETFVVRIDTCPSGLVVTRSRPNLDILVNGNRRHNAHMGHSQSGGR